MVLNPEGGLDVELLVLCCRLLQGPGEGGLHISLSAINDGFHCWAAHIHDLQHPRQITVEASRGDLEKVKVNLFVLKDVGGGHGVVGIPPGA